MVSVDDAGALSEAGSDAGRDGAHGGRRAEGGGLGVNCVGVVGAETESLDGTRVRHEPGLPAVIGLILLHGGFGGGVPTAVRVVAEVVRVNEGGLNLGDAFWLDGLLAVKALGFWGGLLPGAGVGGGGVTGGEL